MTQHVREKNVRFEGVIETGTVLPVSTGMHKELEWSL